MSSLRIEQYEAFCSTRAQPERASINIAASGTRATDSVALIAFEAKPSDLKSSAPDVGFLMSSHHPLSRGSALCAETSSPQVNPELWRRYQTIIDDARYRHFTRIPERIVRFLDTFHIEFDRDTVLERLLSHYLFIAVVDDAIDSGEEGVAQMVFNHLSSAACVELPRLSDVAIVTEVLKCYMDADNSGAMLQLLRRAHCEAISERVAKSMDEYIKHRNALGRATAQQSYLLIQPALKEPNQHLCRLMEEIGAVGCLVDSVIDLRQDHQTGLLNFDLTAAKYVALCFRTATAGLRVLAKNPSLTFILADAVVDNVRDRDRARPYSIPQVESLCQPTARSSRDSVAHPL